VFYRNILSQKNFFVQGFFKKRREKSNIRKYTNRKRLFAVKNVFLSKLREKPNEKNGKLRLFQPHTP